MIVQSFLSVICQTAGLFQVVVAGMPTVTITLSDMFRMRVQTISFFCLIVLISAWVIQKFWNSIQKEFPKLFRLSYKMALLTTLLWGLLFLFVLTMISGARELMTPGAWKQVGRTSQLNEKYQKKEEEKRDAEAAKKILAERRQSINILRTVLWAEAATQGGKFPNDTDSEKFSKELWRQPGDTQAEYLIVAGQQLSNNHTPLVIEQAVYGDGQQFILFTDGLIELLPVKDDNAK